MINMDMIGRPQKNTITIGGIGSSPEFESLVKNLESQTQLDISTDASGFGASDHTSFYSQDVPVLFFFSGLHGDYHRPSDDWDNLNVDGYHDAVQTGSHCCYGLGQSSPNGLNLPERLRIPPEPGMAVPDRGAAVMGRIWAASRRLGTGKSRV